MADGTRVDLRRRTPIADWNLQTPDHRPFAAISISGLERDKARVTIRSLPSGVADVHIALLTACSVVSLGGMAPGAGPVGGSPERDLGSPALRFAPVVAHPQPTPPGHIPRIGRIRFSWGGS
jgi:hypothetical protein